MYVCPVCVYVCVSSNVFLRTYTQSKQLWKFRRYILVIEYENRPMLPPPLIVLSHAYLIIKYFRRKCTQKKHFRDNGLSKTLWEWARVMGGEGGGVEIQFRFTV